MMEDATDLSPVTIDHGAPAVIEGDPGDKGGEVIAPPAAGVEGDGQETGGATPREVEVVEDDGDEGTAAAGGDQGSDRKPGRTMIGSVRARIRQAREVVGETANTVVGVVSSKVVDVTDASRNYLEASNKMAKDMGKRYYDASVNLGKAAVDVSTGVSSQVTAVAQQVNQVTTQRISEVRTNVQGLATNSIAVANRSVHGAKERVVQILRSSTSGEGGEEEEVDDEEYKALLQFERSQEINILPGRRERLPYILQKDHTVTWEFRVRENDLGFVVCETVQDFGGAQELPLVEEQKYKAGHTIKGSYTAPEEKHIALVWDNSYSILRSKVVAYVVRVLRPGGRVSPTPPVATQEATNTSTEPDTETAVTDATEEEEERGVDEATPVEAEVSSADEETSGEEPAPVLTDKEEEEGQVEAEAVVPEIPKVVPPIEEPEAEPIVSSAD